MKNPTVSTIMFLSKLLLPLALIVAVSHADATLNNSQSRILRHDPPPTPSTYPLNEPCVPEWQYLNFNPNDANDKIRLEKLHNVLCSGELRAVLNEKKLSARRNVFAPYQRYFPPSEEFNHFFQSQIQEIKAFVGTFVVDNFGRFLYQSARSFFLCFSPPIFFFFFGVPSLIFFCLHASPHRFRHQ